MAGQAGASLTDDVDGFHPRAFDKADPAPDALFYAQPRFLTHIDDGAITAVTALYRTVLPEGGVILDLMSSWVSHLPEEMSFERVIGHGMNDEELAANPRLDDYFVQDLNQDPSLKLADRCLDAACLCVSVQYLQRPVTVFRELARVLRPGAPLVITFSNRCFPTKAVAIWQALSAADQQRLVSLCLARAGLSDITTGEVCPDEHDPDWRDPIYAVIGRTPIDQGE
jgi:SAM-dependent methyltransferase